MICKFCGCQMPDGSLFCPECGAENKGGRNCPVCNAPLEENSLFCSECGAQIDSTQGKMPTSNDSYNSYNGGYEGGYYNRKLETDTIIEKERSNTAIIVIIITLIVLIAGGAVGVIMYINNSNNDAYDESENKTVSVTFDSEKSSQSTTAPKATSGATEKPQPTQTAPASTQTPAANNDAEQIPQVDVPPKNATSGSTSSGYYYPSNTKYITTAELDAMTPSEIRLILNEMYARHGYIFVSEQYQNYFSAKSWYRGTTTSQDEALKYFNSYELANRKTIVDYETAHGLR